MYFRFYVFYLINFTWDTFKQIAQYYRLVGSLILCFWSLQVDALWNARRRWSCTGRSEKHHEAMQLASKFLLYELNCGWVELWKPDSRNFMKFYQISSNLTFKAPSLLVFWKPFHFYTTCRIRGVSFQKLRHRFNSDFKKKGRIVHRHPRRKNEQIPTT